MEKEQLLSAELAHYSNRNKDIESAIMALSKLINNTTTHSYCILQTYEECLNELEIERSSNNNRSIDIIYQLNNKE